MFTPGQILGVIAFVAIVLLLAAALKWLERQISPEPAETPEPTPTVAEAAPTVTVRRRTPRARGKK